MLRTFRPVLQTSFRSRTFSLLSNKVPMSEEPKSKRLKKSPDFDGEICIVTGGTTGIGEACCRAFSEAGGKVFNIDMKKPTGKVDYLTSICDVSDTKKLKTTIADILKETNGRVDHLICNAGVHIFSDVETTTEEQFDKVCGVNIRGNFFAMQAVLPAMRAQKKGSIVIIGSDQSFIGKASQQLYGLTKGAMGQLTKSMAVQYAKDGIRTNAVCPGTIDTPLVNGPDGAVARLMKMNPGTTKAHWQKVLDEGQPITRLGTPDEIAQAVIMCSKNGFMTGALIAVDGGYTAQ